MKKTMDQKSINSILLSVIGGLILILISISGYFANKMITSVSSLLITTIEIKKDTEAYKSSLILLRETSDSHDDSLILLKEKTASHDQEISQIKNRVTEVEKSVKTKKLSMLTN